MTSALELAIALVRVFAFLLMTQKSGDNEEVALKTVIFSKMKLIVYKIGVFQIK